MLAIPIFEAAEKHCNGCYTILCYAMLILYKNRCGSHGLITTQGLAVKIIRVFYFIMAYAPMSKIS